MKRVPRCFVCCVIFWGFAAVAAEPEYYSRFISQVGTNHSGALYSWGTGEEFRAPTLVDTNNTRPQLTRSKLSELTLKPQVAVAGVSLGMAMEEVIAIWGKPRAVGLYNHDAPILRYWGSRYWADSYAAANILFHPRTNSVMAIWLMFPRYRADGLPWLSPKVDECLRVLGEPVGRNYIPDPFDGSKQVPKHWYCRMIYKQPPLLLYFADGQLMALEVNPMAKGVAPEGKGSDDYSIGFCLE